MNDVDTDDDVTRIIDLNSFQFFLKVRKVFKIKIESRAMSLYFNFSVFRLSDGSSDTSQSIHS